MLVRLIGPGGAGKSTAGRLLAGHLGLPFVDLDACFMAAHGDIAGCIAAQGYAGYAARNVALYQTQVAQAGAQAQVLALSSGFMAYPDEVHPAYARCRAQLLASPATFVLLPSRELETCVAETVRRQLARPFRRSAAREEQVIRSRFALYRELPVDVVETLRPEAAVVADLAARLAALAPCVGAATSGAVAEAAPGGPP